MSQQCDEHTEDCPRPVVWRWRDPRRLSESVYLCDEHAADKDLSQLEDLIAPGI